MHELENSKLPPQIVKYQDYHQFLLDFYRFKKQQNPRFSFRKFALLSGIKSSNFLMLVMGHKRRLSPKAACAVARAMKLSKAEGDYFVSLVRLEHARQEDDKARAEKERKIAIKKIIAKEVTAEKAEYLSVWYYSLVRELAFLSDFQPKPDWISRRLGGLISLEQADKAIKLLTRLGLWRWVEGQVRVSEVFLDTGTEDRTFGEINVASIHRQNLIVWAKMIENLPKEKRELGLINIPIRAEKIPELKQRIQQFQDEIIGWLQDERDPTELVQLGTYLVPVSTTKTEAD